MRQIHSRLRRAYGRAGHLLGPGCWFSKRPGAMLQRHLFRNGARAGHGTIRLVGLILYHYMFAFWQALYLCTVRHPSSHRPREFAHLCYLGLWLGVSPADYYRLKLRSRERSSWIDYCFPNQQLAWLKAYSHGTAEESVRIIQSKSQLADLLSKCGIAAPSTLSRWRQGSRLSEKDLLTQGDVFIKPDTLNRSRGCASIRCSNGNLLPALYGFDLTRSKVERQGAPAIVEFVNAMLQHTDLLVQRMLQNAPGLAAEANCLQTLRVITCAHENMVRSIFANFETAADLFGPWSSHPIDVNFPEADIEENRIGMARYLAAEQLAQDAHQHFSDVLLIAWDIAITPDGPLVLEGNTGWSITQLQRLYGKPLLECLPLPVAKELYTRCR